MLHAECAHFAAPSKTAPATTLRPGRGCLRGGRRFLWGGLLGLLGADKYKDFYFEMKARSSGTVLDYEKLGEFCGWTGQPLPGESDLAYGIRSFWNMLQAMAAMSAVSLLAFFFLGGGLFFCFRWAGAFED